MLQFENLSESQLQEVRIACAYLFSPELGRDDKFLINLDFASIKKALGKKAKDTILRFIRMNRKK